MSWDVRWVRDVGSTNAEAVALAREGAPEGLVVVADHQSAGRGRLGRTWEAPPGSSLLASLVFRPGPSLSPGLSYLLSWVVALAAADACRAMAGVDPGLKWPNDLVVETDDGLRKLGGILSESDLDAGVLRAAVVGIGLNVNWPPAVPESLAGIAVAANHLCGRDLDRPTLLFALLDGVAGRYARLFEPDGWQAVAAEYRDRCVTLGRAVRVELGTETLDGTAVDLSEDGHLGLDTAGGRRWVAAGDVTHVRRT